MKKSTSPTLSLQDAPLRRIVAAGLLALASLSSHAQLDPKASRFYEDALTRFEKKDYAGAVVQLKNALKVDNKSIAVQVLLGKALLANGDIVAAEVALNEALSLGVNRAEVILPLARAISNQGRQQLLLDNPRFAPAGLPASVQLPVLLMRAGAAADLGDARSALRSIDEARALDAASPEPWLAEVPVRIRQRQFAEATSAADRALQLSPQSAEALYVRGTVAHVRGDLPAALSFYDRALKINPEHVEALVSRAGVAMDQNRQADAERDITLLLKSSPTEPRGSYLRALLSERQGNVNAARSAYNDVTALLDPVPPEFLRHRPQLLMLGGLSHYALQQFEKAKPYLEMVVRAQPNSPVSKLLAQLYLRENNVDRAIEALDRYLKVFPGDTQATILLASAHMSQGRHHRATQLTQDALKQRDSADLRTVLGMSLVGGGKVANAVTELEAAIKKDPAQVQAGSALATIYIQSNQPNRAAKLAEQLVKQQANNPGLHNLLGDARAAAGDAAGARSAYLQAVTLDANFGAPQIGLARLDAQAGALDQAAARLNALLARDGKNIDAVATLAAFNERRGQLAEAQRLLERADDLAGPNNFGPGVALVDFHLRNGQVELARNATSRILGKAPEALPVLMATARVQLGANDITAARATLSRAAGVASYDAPLLLRIALLQIQAGHIAGAAFTLEKALAERPDLLQAQATMVDVEMRQGELGKAEQRARQFAAKNPKLGIGHALLGDVALARNQTKEALDHYRRAHQVEPSSESMLRLYRLQAATDPAAATQLADQWLKSRPKDVAVRRALGDGMARAGNLAAARSHYEALLAVAPQDAEAMNNLANVLVFQKDPGALAMAERALAAKPGAPHIIGTAGWAAFKAGQNDRALQLLRDARLRDPNNPDTRVFLGSVLASVGRQAEAREELQAALKNGTAFAMAKDAQELLRTLR